MKHYLGVFSTVGGRMRIRSSVIALAIGAAAAVQASDSALRLTASSDTFGKAAGISRDVEITITRWSTESERQALVAAFFDDGPWAVREMLHKVRRVGRIKVSTQPEYDLRFAARYPLPGRGHRLILMTDRPMSPWVTWSQVPVSDYPFSLVEMHLDQTGAGSGKLSLSTRIMYDDWDRIVALDRYTRTAPWIKNVRVETRD